MKTWANGWEKRCKYCGGRVRLVENLGEIPNCEFYFVCDQCGSILFEEDVIFEERD